MTATASIMRDRDGDIRLWMIALGLSLAINAGIAAALSLWVLDALKWEIQPPPEDAADERVAWIMPDWSPAAEPPPAAIPKRFARTSPDQTADAPPETSAFEGERNTRATSDRTAMLDAPELPSQAGVEPRDPAEMETTESRFQDGRLEAASSEPSTAESPPVSVSAPPTSPSPVPQPEAESPADSKSMADTSSAPPAVPPQREKAFEGPNPVEVAAQAEIKPAEQAAEPAPPREESPPSPKPSKPIAEESPKEKPQAVSRANDPAFRGFQQKTAIIGSISRTGRSALDVDDTPLGRYQALISRAVELEWQRNCVRHRDFITPGFLTVRFFVEASGKVRSVQFVGDMETGEVQKGFTLNSIRDAPIPKMPDAVKQSQQGDPLELMFRFYF